MTGRLEDASQEEVKEIVDLLDQQDAKTFYA